MRCPHAFGRRPSGVHGGAPRSWHSRLRRLRDATRATRYGSVGLSRLASDVELGGDGPGEGRPAPRRKPACGDSARERTEPETTDRKLRAIHRHALGDAGALCGGAKRSGSLALDRKRRDSRSWSAACGTLTVERGRRRASIFRSRRSRQPVARRTRKLCSPATSSHGLDVWTAEAEPQVDWSWALGPNVADYPASIFQISTRHRQRPSSCRQITTYFAAADCPPASVSVARPIS